MEDTISVTTTDVTTYTVNTHPATAALGIKVINCGQDEFSPLMIHDYTCLRSCAREVFTSPGA